MANGSHPSALQQAAAAHTHQQLPSLNMAGGALGTNLNF